MAKTKGAHHIGLSVNKLEESARFFTMILGWEEVRRDAEYPAIFVSDGVLMVTLWQVKSSGFQEFDRKNNVGLHHLALTVASAKKLDILYQALLAQSIPIVFPPELLRGGPAKHMMCYDPSGIRIEFIST